MFAGSGMDNELAAPHQAFELGAITNIAHAELEAAIIAKRILQKEELAFIIVDRDNRFGVCAQNLVEQLTADCAANTGDEPPSMMKLIQHDDFP